MTPAKWRPGRHIERVPLFWLNYRYADGRFVVVLESAALIHTRIIAAVYGLDRGRDFTAGYELDETAPGSPTPRPKSRWHRPPI
jgi:hypothetical protein